MYEAKTLGDFTAKSLIHSMWFICVTFVGMRTGTEIHNPKWGDVSVGLDEGSGREFLQLSTERQTKTRTGANARDIRQNQPRAYAVLGDPARDPVHLYRTYTDMRPAEMLQESSPFFLSICTSRQGGWYKKSAMGVNKLYNTMNEMKADAGIDEERITPYSARKRMVQKLNDEGVPPNQIVQISGHKNINSLNNYSKLITNQSVEISDNLSNANSNGGPTNASRRNLPASDAAPNMSRGFFVNTNFMGNVTFNFQNQDQNTLSQKQHVVNRNPQIPSPCSGQGERRPVYKRILLISDSESD
ncbi:uncharacterized protein LOC128204867 [Mya arenaria]|uniref:uncharacterized protein LOC128204867 n=1 Tax=Mya arenaria TaxID=6604 RepID=UPI0022E01218|nr:uncharacterized protein LOC128204867 [Mya arenaria]